MTRIKKRAKESTSRKRSTKQIRQCDREQSTFSVDHENKIICRNAMCQPLNELRKWVPLVTCKIIGCVTPDLRTAIPFHMY